MAKREPDTLSLAFAQTVRQLRCRQSGGYWPMTQVEMAKALGMSRTYVNGLESGEHNPSLSTIWQLLPVLRVSAQRFFREMERNYERLQSPSIQSVIALR